MSGSQIKQKNWALSQEAFDKFLCWLDPDRDRAGHRHNRIHHKLCVFFAARGCSDGESLADETINRAARQIEEGRNIDEGREKPVEPEAYIHGIAKYVLLEYYKQPVPVSIHGLAVDQIFKVDPRKDEFEVEDQEKRIASLEQCLQKLDPRDREILLRYYKKESKEGDAKKNRENLARELGVKGTKLRKRIMNIKNRLGACVKEYVEPPDVA